MEGVDEAAVEATSGMGRSSTESLLRSRTLARVFEVGGADDNN